MRPPPVSEHHYPTDESEVPTPSYEQSAFTRAEYISTLVHFYRGELDRATQWRLRLDTTTNWAIFSVMGLITFTLGEPTHTQVGVLAGMALVTTFLGIEARRFRFFDVWRARVHMLEENFFGPILRRDLRSPTSNWGNLVADDLLRPRFKITYHQALRARLLRNYGVLFLLLLMAWILKLIMHGAKGGEAPPFTSWETYLPGLLTRMQIGPIPWWVPLCYVMGLYFYLIAVIILVPSVSSAEHEYWGTMDEENEPVSRIDV